MRKNNLDKLAEYHSYIHEVLDATKGKHPDKFLPDKPPSIEGWQLAVQLKISRRILQLVLHAFEMTFLEGKYDNNYELEVVIGFPYEKVRCCHEKLKQQAEQK